MYRRPARWRRRKGQHSRGTPPTPRLVSAEPAWPCDAIQKTRELSYDDSRLVLVNWRATSFLFERKDFILINLHRKGNPIMSEKNSVVAILTSHDQAEDTVRELQKNGFDMKKLSIVGKDYHTDEQSSAITTLATA